MILQPKKAAVRSFRVRFDTGKQIIDLLCFTRQNPEFQYLLEPPMARYGEYLYGKRTNKSDQNGIKEAQGSSCHRSTRSQAA